MPATGGESSGLELKFSCSKFVHSNRCNKSNADVRPTAFDNLAQGTGHWEWESTGYQSGLRTPASMGFANEPDLGNNDTKIYRIAQQNGHQMLFLVGTAACFDGSAVETYHLVAQ